VIRLCCIGPGLPGPCPAARQGFHQLRRTRPLALKRRATASAKESLDPIVSLPPPLPPGRGLACPHCLCSRVCSGPADPMPCPSWCPGHGPPGHVTLCHRAQGCSRHWVRPDHARFVLPIIHASFCGPATPRPSPSKKHGEIAAALRLLLGAFLGCMWGIVWGRKKKGLTPVDVSP
jgi:hypothetical protein